MSEPWKLHGYVIERPLGGGASGEVWRARVAATGEAVALKRLRPGNVRHQRGLHTEAAMLSALDHPNLIRLHAVVPDEQTPGRNVLVLDLADAGSLADLLDVRGRLSPGEVVTALAPVAAALAYAHAQGVVHGDVSAANVLFTGSGTALLADLGVARLTGDDADAESTPAYVDPAVAAGCVPGPQSDVFMLGGVALHALTGTPTWPGTNAEQSLAAARSGVSEAVYERLTQAEIPEPVAAVVRRALSADSFRRGTAADFALDLRASATPEAVDFGAGRRRAAMLQNARMAAAAGRGRSHGGRHAAKSSGTNPPGASPPGASPPAASPPAASPPAASPPPASPPAGASRQPKTPPAATAPAAVGAATQLRWRTITDDAGAVADAPPPGALPPTRQVGPRPRPQLPRPRGTRAWWLALGAAAALLALLAAFLLTRPGGSGTHHARGLPTASAPSGVHTPSPGVGSTGSQPTGSSSRATAPHSGDRWAAALAALDQVRARAFAERRPDLLRNVYANPTLLKSDTALLERLVPRGCGLLGVHTSYRDVQVTPDGDQARVRTTAVMPPSRLVCGGHRRATARGLGPLQLVITLSRTRDGVRITAEQHPGQPSSSAPSR